MIGVRQANMTSSQKGEEKIKEKSRQATEAVQRRETTLLTELKRLSTERQSAIDSELDRIRYNITRSVIRGSTMMATSMTSKDITW